MTYMKIKTGILCNQNTVLYLIVTALLCFLSPKQIYANEQVMLIGEVAIQGNRKIEAATIRSYINTQAGSLFNPTRIRQDIQAIYDSGFFSDIQVDAEDFEGKLKLTFIVTEKPSIKSVIIEGNDEIDEEKLRKVIDVKINSILDELVLDRNVDKIKKRYEEDGFYLAEVTYKIEKIPPHSVNVTFTINEGPEVVLEKIIFEGNEAVSDDDLKDILETSEHWFLSWITNSGHLEKDKLSQDMNRLLIYYYDHGYIQAKIGDPKIELSTDKTELTVTIPVEEGNQFVISKINLKGNYIVATSEIEEKLESKAGEVFNRSTIRKDVDYISNLYAGQGYLLTDVYPNTKENRAEKTVEVTFNVQEGKITYAGQINISGNTSTRDKVIRRQLMFFEGDVLTSTRLKRSYQRINNLGFFEQVDLKTKASSQENALDIDLRVKERLTGSFSMGAGWSSVNKVVGNVSISQGNLFGRGQRLVLSGSFGRIVQNFNLEFTEPWLFDTPLSAGFALYSSTRKRLSYNNYQVDRTGGKINLGYPLTSYTRAYFNYRYDVADVRDIPSNASIIIKRQKGKTTTSSTTFTLVRDSRDNRLRPTSGSNNSASYEFAGSILGGTNYFHRTAATSSWHFPLFWKFVFSTRGQIRYQSSYAGRKLPIQELFVTGGAQTVRGFQGGSLGPREGYYVIGGNKSLVFNAEIHFPLFDPLAGVLFFDMGNVFAEGVNYQLNNLRTGAGVGIRFFTPMGPIRLDWGYKLDRKDRESAYEWHFAMGTYF